jgi:di/tricarboxylate transporter
VTLFGVLFVLGGAFALPSMANWIADKLSDRPSNLDTRMRLVSKRTRRRH